MEVSSTVGSPLSQRGANNFSSSINPLQDHEDQTDIRVGILLTGNRPAVPH